MVVADILDALGHLSAGVLYLVAFGLAFGEAAFLLDLLVPGEVGLVIVGAAAQQHDGTLPVLVLIGAAGAVAGDSMSWLIGRRWGTSLVHRWGWTRRHVAPQLDKATDVLDRRGGPAIFGARWVGALRALVPMVAGAARVPYRTLLMWDVPAAIGWSSVVVGLGWYLGAPVAGVVDRYGGYLSIAVVVGLATWWLIRRRRRRRPS